MDKSEVIKEVYCRARINKTNVMIRGYLDNGWIITHKYGKRFMCKVIDGTSRAIQIND